MLGRVCLITQSWVADDPRVRKHGDTLSAAGFQVTGVGFRGGRSSSPNWPVVELEPPEPSGLAVPGTTGGSPGHGPRPRVGRPGVVAVSQ